MKLIHEWMLHTSLVLTLVLAVWAVGFYWALMEEVNDEVDDSLEDYTEVIVTRSLAGQELPSASIGSNNQYYLREVTEAYAHSHPHIRYADRDVYIREKKEFEPARVLTTIFRSEDGRYHEVEVSTPSIEKNDLRESIFYWMVFLYVSLLLTFICINALIFHRNMRPLYVLLQWLDRYELGKKNLPLNNPTGITEFRTLNEAAVRNAERNERLYEQQKEFIGNASHEMQTPLAICQSRLETLLEEEGLTEHQMGELIKTRRTLQNLTRMNRSLLLLCKIENGQFQTTDRVTWNTLLDTYIDDYRQVFAHRHIDTTVEERGTFVTEMDESLASTLLTNLLKNAFVHNRPEGFIRITIDNDRFTIRNTGVEEPLDTEQIFTRFYHTSGREGSTGLGLPMVEAICRLYRMCVSYRYEDALHVFEVKRTPQHNLSGQLTGHEHPA